MAKPLSECLWLWLVVLAGIGLTGDGTLAATSKPDIACGTRYKKPSVRIPAAAERQAPSLKAVSTGAKRITVYWWAVPKATRYELFRREVRRGSLWTRIYSGKPAQKSFLGSDWFRYVDTDKGRGLKDREYQYQVRALYGRRIGPYSAVDSDVPDPTAVPWDSNDPKLIMEAINRNFESEGQEGLRSDSTSILSPDGRVYEYDAKTGRYTAYKNPWVEDIDSGTAINRETGEEIALPNG